MKKRFLSAVLTLALCLSLPCSALGAEGDPAPAEEMPKSYEQAVAELGVNAPTLYATDKFFDTDLCSVFLYHRIGIPHGPYSKLTAVYKAGSPLGEGATVNFPLHISGSIWAESYAPDTVELSEDGRTLIYTYFSPDSGTELYTADLTTGEVTTSELPPTQDQLISWYTDMGITVEKRLEGTDYTAALMWSEFERDGKTSRDYYLYLFCQEPATVEPEKQIQRLLLPSTAAAGEKYPQYPTDRGPDELFFNEDGSVLSYVYRFDDVLYNAAGELLHDVGTYTYRVDTATGELTVAFEKGGASGGEKPPAEGPENDPGPEAPSLEAEGTTFVDVSTDDWFAPYVGVCVEAGLMKGVGEGIFHPQGTVTLAEAATLAGRIHHVKSGGDGNLPKAPEEYGTVTLEFENGVRLRFDSMECGSTISPMSLGHLVANLSEEKMAAIGWLAPWESAQATVWTVLPEPSGPLPCEARRQSGSDGDALVLYPSPDGTKEEREVVDALVVDLLKVDRRPLPGDWFRDTIYYLEKEQLTAPLPLRPSEPAKTATRGDFVEALHATAAELLAPRINHISDFPDAGAEWGSKELAEMVLDFYNAGVMTGKDEFGIFDKGSSLSRAEAAAICARILKPELRVEFQPKPTPEKYSYTLTYLMDDPMSGHEVTYPVMPIITSGRENNGILTLDGELLPWPGDGEKPVGMLSTGGGLYLSFWFTQPDGSRVEMGGLVDETGTFAVPLNAQCYRATEVAGDKYLSQTGLPENGICTLWDGGNATELGSMNWYNAVEAYGYPAPGGELDVRRGLNCYINGLGHRLSEDFDWISALTDDGRGFVGKDEKIYRIEFKAL